MKNLDATTNYASDAIRSAREVLPSADSVFGQAEFDSAAEETAGEQAITKQAVVKPQAAIKDTVDITTADVTQVDDTKQAVTVTQGTLGSTVSFFIKKQSKTAKQDAQLGYPGPGAGPLNLDTDDIFAA